MMRNILWTMGLLCTCVIANAQEYNGIKFRPESNWDIVKHEAKKENKYIFIDCYATWCAPCRLMDVNIFSKKEIGDQINDKFIGLKVQMDVTKDDDENVRRWYKDARWIMNQYKIKEFPTFLIFSPDGQLVHRGIGYKNMDGFLTMIKDGQDSAKQYYTLVRKFRDKKMDFSQMESLINSARLLNDSVTFDAVRQTYEDGYLRKLSHKQLMSGLNLSSMARLIYGTSDWGFVFFTKNAAEIDSVLGPCSAEKKIIAIISKSEINAKIYSFKTNDDWDRLENELGNRFGHLGIVASRQQRLLYYWQTRQKNWKDYGYAYNLYYQIAGDLNVFNINNFAWDIFQNINDRDILLTAIRVMYGPKSDNALSMDTYANLLYKLNSKTMAIDCEKKAIAMEEALAATQHRKPSLASFQDALKKMENGTPTW
jgi:thioredoxin-related protein